MKVFETFFSYKITSGARVKNKIHGGNQTSILMLNGSSEKKLLRKHKTYTSA